MLNAAQIRQASIAVRELRVSLSNFFLYSSENAMVKQSLDRLLGVLNGLFGDLPSISFGESEGRLVVEGAPLDERLTGSTNMIKDLFLTQKIHTLTFHKGVQASEIQGLFLLLKPRALPPGVTLPQALAGKNLEHVKVDEKVFVAIGEGEVVVPGDAALGGEQNLQEALEALQYFLQVFGRVKPETNKQEVAKRLMENLGAWIRPEDLAAVSGPEEGGKAASPAPGPNAQPWRELMASFLAMKNVLASMKTPAQVSEAQDNVDDLLKKLVLLGESQGVRWEEKAEPKLEGPSSASPAPEAASRPPAPPEQENLFETDPILAAVQSGDWNTLLSPSIEEKLAEKIPFLQEPGQAEAFEGLWEKLWARIFSPEEEAQNLALRHLNRIQWNSVPRALQLEGLRNLRVLLLRIRNPAPFPSVLAVTQDWLAQELNSPDWMEVLETTRLLTELSDMNPPYFEGQTLAARATLETVFCEPVLDHLLSRYGAGEKEDPSILRLFKELGRRTIPFLFQKIEKSESGSPPWRNAVAVLESLQADGLQVYETILEWPEKRSEMEKFLEIFQVAVPTGELEDYFERYWNTFSQAAQVKILSIAGKWKRRGLHPLLDGLLQNPDSPLALAAMEALTQLGIDGDGGKIVAAVQRHSGRNKEVFWVKACQTLGALQDTPAATALMEWAAKYKFMEQKKGRTLEVRRAAIQALGRFHSETVRDFLLNLRADGEKELKSEVEEALKSVEATLSPPPGI